MSNKLKKSFSSFDNLFSKKPVILSGELGIDINNTHIVEVPGRDSYVYVRLRSNLSEIIQAFNDKISPSHGLPVLLQREGNRYTIIGRDTQRYSEWEEKTPILKNHASTHILDKEGGNIGTDPVYVYPYQFLPSLVSPFPGGNTSNVYIFPCPINFNNSWKYIGNTGTQKLTTYNPTSGARFLLISLDVVTGNPYILATTGSYIPENITGTSQMISYLPNIDTTRYMPLSYVRLLSGTSTIGWESIYDVRQFINMATTGSNGGISSIGIQEGGLNEGNAGIINFVGTGFDISVSGTTARVLSNNNHESLTGLLGGIADAHFHLTPAQINGLVSGTTTTLHNHSPYNSLYFTGTTWNELTNKEITFLHSHLSSGTSGDVIFNIDGDVIDITGASVPYLLVRPATIESWYLYATNTGFVSGTTIVVRTGTTQSLFTNQNNRPMLLYNDPNGWAISGVPGITNFIEGDILYPDIDQHVTGTKGLAIVGKMFGIVGGTDAPSNGILYGRKNAAWEGVPPGGAASPSLYVYMSTSFR